MSIALEFIAVVPPPANDPATNPLTVFILGSYRLAVNPSQGKSLHARKIDDAGCRQEVDAGRVCRRNGLFRTIWVGMRQHACPILDDAGANHHSPFPGDMAARGSHAGHTDPAPTTALEMIAVTVGTIAAVKLLGAYCPRALQWLAIPGILVGAALLPTWVRRRGLPDLGLGINRVRPAVRAAGCACVCTFPFVFLGLWLLRLLDRSIPLPPIDAWQPDPFSWLLYQFLYVAVAEEVFFRGYIQSGMARLVDRARSLSRTTRQCVVIAVSAACFALAHVIIQGQIISALVFLPGLVMAWLYVRTRSIWAPILFHGLANVFYGVVALVLN